MTPGALVPTPTTVIRYGTMNLFKLRSLWLAVILFPVTSCSKADEDSATVAPENIQTHYFAGEITAEHAAEVLREHLAEKPEDWHAKYSLASILVDSKRDADESFRLLQELEQARGASPWLEGWLVVRKVQWLNHQMESLEQNFPAAIKTSGDQSLRAILTEALDKQLATNTRIQ